MTEPVKVHPHAFRNEPVTDFSKSANREAMERALSEVRGQFGTGIRALDRWTPREDAG